MKRFGLPKSERIKKRNDFETIYALGRTVFSADKKLKAVYIIEKETKLPGVKIAVAVGRKSGIAFWRNRVKRLLRAAYRQNKEILTAVCSDEKIMIKIVFSPNLVNRRKNKVLILDDLMPGVIDILTKIKSTLL